MQVELNKNDTLHATYDHPLFGTLTTSGKVLHCTDSGALVDFNGVRVIMTPTKLAQCKAVMVEPAARLRDLFRKAVS